jgi:hypothetical protein
MVDIRLMELLNIIYERRRNARPNIILVKNMADLSTRNYCENEEINIENAITRLRNDTQACRSPYDSNNKIGKCVTTIK